MHTHNHSHTHTHSHTHCNDCGAHTHAGWRKWLRPAVSAVLTVIGMIAGHFGLWPGGGWIEPLFYLLAFLPVGLPVIGEALAAMRHGDVFSEFTLMSVAAIGAFAIREYPEGVAVMLLYVVGETLQDGAVDRATRNISHLLDMRPETASVVRDGKVEDVRPDTVSPGETVEVLPGGRVPLDGVLLAADAEFDTAALTGESMPREIPQGGEVLAGMIAVGRPVRIRVTRHYGESALARILKLVREASSRKAPAELFIRRFARVYTPVVMALALLLVVLPAFICPLTGHPYVFSQWLYRALVFLVISCPCALVISVPLGYYAGIGAASRLGILFKGGNYLDALAHIDTVAFDKTGTLTKGSFEVRRVVVESPFTEDYLNSVAGAVEAQSTHPIARAITTYAASRSVAPASLTDLHERSGYGVTARVGGKDIAVGNSRLMRQIGVTLPTIEADAAATVIYCAVDAHFAGAYVLSDSLKDDALESVAKLRRDGIRRIVVLSGDRQEIVDTYAAQVMADQAAGQLLPEDKVNRVGELKQQTHGKVAFVGDGMNDAPVLAVSDIGIAMGGGGSDAAVESADIVIRNDRLAGVASALTIARRTRLIVRENIYGAISVKMLILLAGAFGTVSLWLAVLADVGVALLAVANSIRLLHSPKMNR